MQFTIDDQARPGLANLILAARDTAPVSGLTHNFYRYPARFSPGFVRAAIEAFTKPGEWVMDPFVGGGTTLVEAIALGRHALGIDISSLATFICEAKTLELSAEDAQKVRCWAEQLVTVVNIHAASDRDVEYAEAGYYRNLEGCDFWRLRKAIEQVLNSVEKVQSSKAHTLARCILLRTAQWALDARKTIPAVSDFRRELVTQADAMIAAATELRIRVNNLAGSGWPRVVCLNRSAAGLDSDDRIADCVPPKLILTSPPYPGIHVLYHRWQVDGRKEAPAPFWIANRLDGAGLSHYTMGDRKNPSLRNYFTKLRDAFTSISRVCGPRTTVVQMVAFSEPDWQLPTYLDVMADCGLHEVRPWHSPETDVHGRLWRDVPRRKWHANQNRNCSGSREVVLIHQKRKP